MNTERYISAGILEKHFLGLITPEEKEELDHVMSLYPELVKEMEEVERRMERTIFNNAIQPPEHVKLQFLELVQEKDPVFVAPPSNKITVHVSWKVYLIFNLVLIALGLVATVLCYLYKKH